MKLTVLRLGHRKKRDPRLTTHVALTARALGADEVIISGEKDEGILNSIKDVSSRWGGNFKVEYRKQWKKIVTEFKEKGALIVHLTMYGLPYQQVISEIKKTDKDLLLVVGSEKVPGEIYKLADYNVSVTSQPHSEASALALFLHDFFEGKELNKKFENAEIKIVPHKKTKEVIKS